MQRIKLTFLFVYSTLTVLLSGCAKENLRHQDFSGTVTNLTTDDVLIGAKVQLIEEHIPAEPFSPVTRTVLQEVLTDASGSFSFDRINKVRRDADYFVELERNWYYSRHGWQKGSYSMVNSVVNVNERASEPLDLSTVPLGEFNLRVTNTHSDSIFVHGVFRNGLIELNVFEMILFERQFLDVSDVEVPSGTYQVEWLVVHESDSIWMTEQLNVPFAENVNFNFEY